jgi:cytochrome P450
MLASANRSIDGGAIGTAEGRAIIHTMLAAGGESTSSLLVNAAGILASDQSLQRTLHAQPQLIPNFIEEVLRLESPFRFHLRSVARATSLGHRAARWRDRVAILGRRQPRPGRVPQAR